MRSWLIFEEHEKFVVNVEQSSSPMISGAVPAAQDAEREVS